jgi:L-histidine Nalpha-methyltransferase
MTDRLATRDASDPAEAGFEPPIGPGNPADPAMLAEIREGMSRLQKELSPKHFYDQRGSELFEQITRLPEYYPTRTERALLQRWMPGWIGSLRPAALVELGAGSADKTRVVLDAILRHHQAPLYVPVDVSETFLHETANRLRDEYPSLVVRPAVADISGDFHLRDGYPSPVLYAFLGSTIGNFEPGAARRLLGAVRAVMSPVDRFLVGVDLRKDVDTLEAAYNDSRGVTAEFNLNMLRVLNQRAGANFDPTGFEHRAFYNGDAHRIEMHLVARVPQRVSIPGAGSWAIAAGESIRTEISCKHDRASAEALLDSAGLVLRRWETDERDRFAILLCGSAA